jgi:hypothetical protein
LVGVTTLVLPCSVVLIVPRAAYTSAPALGKSFYTFQPVTKEFIRSLRGFLKSETSVTKDLLRERKAEREAEEASLAGHRSR